jgi:CubicO group peptidase (beta-lactamase class C family)
MRQHASLIISLLIITLAAGNPDAMHNVARARQGGARDTLTTRQQPREAELPTTPLGRMARGWLEAINGGSEAALKQFVETNFSASALRGQGAADYVRLFLKLRQQSGGLELLRVTPPVGENPMVLTAKTKRGHNFARIMLGEDSREPGKLIGLGVSRVEPPDAQGGWTERPLAEAEMIAEIKKRVERRAADGRFSGVVLVARNGRILLHEAHGSADREADAPNTKSTKFHLASVGKMFTAVAIAQLVKAGKLAYTDTVAKLLPDYPDRQAAEKITVHHLLTHSSGMGTFFDSPGYNAQRVHRNATEEIAVYKDEPLFFAPGARWRYSNAGFSLLGAIIERATGQTYLEYVRANIFRPLGMRDTDTNAPGEEAAGSAVLYTQSPDDPLGLDPYVANRRIRISHGTGFGDGSSTASDLLKFADALHSGRLLGAELTRTMVTPKIDQNDESGRRWGYGIMERIVNGETIRGHSGGGRTDVQTLWTSGYTVIVQTNTVPPPATALSGEIINFMTRQLAARRKG